MHTTQAPISFCDITWQWRPQFAKLPGFYPIQRFASPSTPFLSQSVADSPRSSRIKKG